NPAEFLVAVNEGIIYSLPQNQRDSNDGMDVSILAFDLNKRTVDFAGANRPMWLIRNGELLTYKPNKFPIGGMQIIHEEKFSQHHIQLQPNDTIYIFSDGYADQFGGEHGKKLMTKRFKEILVSIQHLSMLQQQLHLKRLFEKWKGQHSQVDDVLVIGIKIP
ncbi:MAG TPA: SpoIIE family protein phosphatase, partial [Bacteroidia bacterium]|nr:SpoIIE family protein phosphatase [Bacteroidia bacterium]